MTAACQAPHRTAPLTKPTTPHGNTRATAISRSPRPQEPISIAAVATERRTQFSHSLRVTVPLRPRVCAHGGDFLKRRQPPCDREVVAAAELQRQRAVVDRVVRSEGIGRHWNGATTHGARQHRTATSVSWLSNIGCAAGCPWPGVHRNEWDRQRDTCVPDRQTQPRALTRVGLPVV